MLKDYSQHLTNIQILINLLEQKDYIQMHLHILKNQVIKLNIIIKLLLIEMEMRLQNRRERIK